MKKDKAKEEQTTQPSNEVTPPEVDAAETPAEEQVPIKAGAEEEPLGTTDKLFPDFKEPEKDIPNNPDPEIPEVKAQPDPEAPEGEIAEFLDIDANAGKKVKVKIDGVESEITFGEAIKGYQTDQHLTRKGQRLADMERASRETLEAMKQSQANQQVQSPPELLDDEFMDEHTKKYIQELKADNQQIRQVLTNIEPYIIQLAEDQILGRLDKTFKQEGFNDFQDRVKDIRAHILTLSVEEQAFYNSEQGYADIYRRFKLQEKNSPPKPGNGAESVPKRPQPKIVKVEPGGGTGNAADDSNWNETYQKLLKQAKLTGNNEDWKAVVQHQYG